MVVMRGRPLRKCARSHNLVPVSLSGGMCDFLSLSEQIINSAVDGPAQGLRSGAPGLGPEGKKTEETPHPDQQRYLEVINELCRRYVGYLMWAHEPCKSAPGPYIKIISYFFLTKKSLQSGNSESPRCRDLKFWNLFVNDVNHIIK